MNSRPNKALTPLDTWLRFAVFAGIATYVFFAMFRNFTPAWEILVLFALALTPISIAKFTIGKEGATLESFGNSGSMDAEEPSNPTPSTAPVTTQANLPGNALMEALASNPLEGFSEQAGKVLRTLRYFQKKEFGNSRKRIWAFSIVPGAPDYTDFFKGINELYGKGLVQVNPEGLAGLSAKGLHLVSEPGDWSGPIWTNFRPV